MTFASRLLLTAALAVGLAAAHSSRAEAGDSPVVMELFTSQGCSSCPPADELLGRFADRDDVIALSLHVDYWDYLGWKDVFGLPVHTTRQKRYAKSMRERMIYTPQIVVNGVEGMVGSRANLVEDAVRRHAMDPAAAEVRIALQGDRLRVDVAPLRKGAKGRIVMAWFSRAENVTISAGENEGRRVTYHNVVRGWSDLGGWDGKAMSLTVPKPMAADGVAVLVQKKRIGPVHGAAKLMLND